MEYPFIRAEHVSFQYQNEAEPERSVPVLHDVSFDVERGSFVAVIGHNGSGKSTLAKLLNLILWPTSGKIYIDGKDVSSEELSEEEIVAVRRKVGMVFQNPDNQIVATVVEEDVAFGPENLGIPTEEIQTRVTEALQTVNMTEYRMHAPHLLSGGQKQRIAIAGIIAMLPECIIFDESTAMLDPIGREEVMQTIEKLNKEKNITVILITHYMDEAARADRVIVLDGGCVILDGQPNDVFVKVNELRQAGLDVPQSTDLLNRLADRGISVNRDVLTVEDAVREILGTFETR